MISTKITLSCDNKECRKSHVVEGPNATRAQLYKESKAEGWQWKSAEVQYCPTHKTVKAPKPKKEKKAKSTTAKVIKKASGKKAPNAAKKASVKSEPSKPSPVWTPAPVSTSTPE